MRLLVFTYIVVMNVQENQVGLKLSITYQILHAVIVLEQYSLLRMPRRRSLGIAFVSDTVAKRLWKTENVFLTRL
jgi:hypothetical protein